MVNAKCIPVVGVRTVEVGGVTTSFVSLMILQYGSLQQKFIRTSMSYTRSHCIVVYEH